MEEYSRNWASIAAYAIAGIEMALLDIKGKALGVPVAELLGGICRSSVPVIGYLFIDEPEANAGQGGRVRRGRPHRAEAQGRARASSQDYDTIAAIRDRVGPDVKLRIDANMNWSVPAAIKWIRALEQFDLQFVEQPVPDFDLAGMAQVRRAVATPIAADESCTTVRSALELIKADACDVFVVYPSEAGGLTRARPDRRARGGGRQVVRDRQLGRARRRDDRERPPRRRVAELPVRQRHPLSAAARGRPRRAGRRSSDGRIAVSGEPGLGVTLDPEAVATLVRARAPRVPVLRRHPRRGPQRRPDPLSEHRCGLPTSQVHSSHAPRRTLSPRNPETGGVMSDKPNESSLFERTVSRRELLEKAGKLGAGAVVAGALAGPAAAATKRSASPRRSRPAARSPGRSSRTRASSRRSAASSRATTRATSSCTTRCSSGTRS